MEPEGPQGLFALETLVAHGELGLGEGEGMPQMEGAVHVGIGESHKVLGLGRLGRAGGGSILLEALLLSPTLLRLGGEFDQEVTAGVGLWSGSVALHVAILYARGIFDHISERLMISARMKQSPVSSIYFN